MAWPTLKQFAELSEQDFRGHPVWIACHVADYDEPWHDETDEETFRPHTGSLPADPEDDLLVSAVARLSDGTEMPGFLTPALRPGDLPRMQPHLFAGGAAHGFWGGMIGIPEAHREALLAALERSADEIFPIAFAADSSLCGGIIHAEVAWWTQRDSVRPAPKPRRWWQRSK